MFKIGEHTLIGTVGIAGLLGRDFDEKDPRIKPVLVEPVKLARHLAMLFVIEFRLDPELFVGKRALWS